MATQHAGVKRLRAPLDGFIVDGFHYCQPDVRHYLLTHAHSDHTCGLHASFDLGTIYCSSTTARILRATLGVQPKMLVTINVGESIEVAGTLITALDAGHCPGALMFLLEHLASGYVALHTGDCRASPDVREAVRAELRRLLPHRTLVTLLAVSTRTPRAAGRPQTHAAATAPAAPVITPIPPGASNRQRKRRLGDCRDAESHPAGVASPDVSMNGGEASGEASGEAIYRRAAGEASTTGLATSIAAGAAAVPSRTVPSPSAPSPAPLRDVPFPDEAPALALDVLYLDTTYSNPRWHFPPQPEALRTLAAVAAAEKAREPQTLFVVGSYQVGKEKAIAAVARAVSGRALVSPHRGLSLRLCGAWDDTLHTEDENCADIAVHVMPLSGGAEAHAAMLALLGRFEGRFKAVVTFRPTGWEYSKAYRDRVEQPGGAHATEKEAAARETAAGIDEARPASQVRPDDGARPVDEPRPADEAGGGGGVWAGLPRPWVENEGRTRSYGVPYSEHSSWDELQAFVSMLRPRCLIPTVNADTSADRERLVAPYVQFLDLSKDKRRLDWFFKHRNEQAGRKQNWVGAGGAEVGQGAASEDTYGEERGLHASSRMAFRPSPAAITEQKRRWEELTRAITLASTSDDALPSTTQAGTASASAPPTCATAGPSTSHFLPSSPPSPLSSLRTLLGPHAPLPYARQLLLDANGDIATAANVHFAANQGIVPPEFTKHLPPDLPPDCDLARNPPPPLPAVRGPGSSAAHAADTGGGPSAWHPATASAPPPRLPPPLSRPPPGFSCWGHCTAEEEEEEEELILPPGSVAWVMDPARGKSYALYRSRADIEARLGALGALVVKKGSRLQKGEVTLLVIPEGAEAGSVSTSLCPSARVVRESWVSKRSLALRAGLLPQPAPAAATVAARRAAGQKRSRADGGGAAPGVGGGGSSDGASVSGGAGGSAPSIGTGVPSHGEKRALRERQHSAASRARAERALSERLYLLERRDLSVNSESGRRMLSHRFAVLGSTGNVYHATICRLPCCTCVDFTERAHVCKHLLFVYLKVLRVPRDSTLPLQKALLATELAFCLTGAGPAPAPLPLGPEPGRAGGPVAGDTAAVAVGGEEAAGEVGGEGAGAVGAGGETPARDSHAPPPVQAEVVASIEARQAYTAHLAVDAAANASPSYRRGAGPTDAADRLTPFPSADGRQSVGGQGADGHAGAASHKPEPSARSPAHQTSGPSSTAAPGAGIGVVLPLCAGEADAQQLPWVTPRPIRAHGRSGAADGTDASRSDGITTDTTGSDGSGTDETDDDGSDLCLVCYDPVTAQSAEAEIAHMVRDAMRGGAAAGETATTEVAGAAMGEAVAVGTLGAAAGGEAAVAAPNGASRLPSTTHCAHGCGRNFHSACIRRWAMARAGQSGLRCPACRAAWWNEDPCLPSAAEVNQAHGGGEWEGEAGGVGRREGFLNLGGLVPGGGSVRDTSTYSEWLQVHQRRREQELMLTGSSGGGARAAASAGGAAAGAPGGGRSSGAGRTPRAGRGPNGARGRGRAAGAGSPSATVLSGWLRRSGGEVASTTSKR